MRPLIRSTAPDDLTVVMHLKHPDNFLLTNLSTGAIGIVPAGSGRDFWQHPVGTGPFRFVSQQIDQDVIVERNPVSWSVVPKLERVRFAVVPDAITESLELEKGSGDVAINSLPMDSLPVLAARPNLQIEETGGTEIQYLGFNLRDPAAQRCARAPGDLLRHRPRADHPHAAGQPRPPRREPAAARPLGLQRRRSALRLRSGARRRNFSMRPAIRARPTASASISP